MKIYLCILLGILNLFPILTNWKGEENKNKVVACSTKIVVDSASLSEIQDLGMLLNVDSLKNVYRVSRIFLDDDIDHRSVKEIISKLNFKPGQFVTVTNSHLTTLTLQVCDNSKYYLDSLFVTTDIPVTAAVTLRFVFIKKNKN